VKEVNDGKCRCEAWFHEYLSEWGWMTLFLHAVAGN
jgi:hypothetical protein